MPQWLCNQLQRAYFKRDRRQIKMLNDCWYFYRNKLGDDQEDKTSSTFR
ncbi:MULTISPECIES: cortex morphogenetic protein CmpA [unclassified Paenibacillus]